MSKSFLPEQNHAQFIIRLIEQGLLNEAEGHCLGLMKESSDPELLYLLAVIRGQNGDYATSVLMFEKALEQLTNRPDVLHNFGVVWQKAGYMAEAKAMRDLIAGLYTQLSQSVTTCEGWMEKAGMDRATLVKNAPEVEKAFALFNADGDGDDKTEE